MSKETSCKERVEQEWESRKEDLQALLEAEDNYTEELGYLNEYGLCLDFVEAGTFKGQREDFVRYQLSTGGPGDELRFYKNNDIEYWFLDWFDGASIDVTDDNIATEIRDYLTGYVSEAPWF